MEKGVDKHTLASPNQICCKMEACHICLACENVGLLPY